MLRKLLTSAFIALSITVPAQALPISPSEVTLSTPLEVREAIFANIYTEVSKEETKLANINATVKAYCKNVNSKMCNSLRAEYVYQNAILYDLQTRYLPVLRKLNQVQKQKQHYNQLTSYFSTHLTEWQAYGSHCQQYPEDIRTLFIGNGQYVDGGCDYYFYIVKE